MSHIENNKNNYFGSKYNSEQYLQTILSPILLSKKTTSQHNEKKLNLNDFIHQKKKFKINNCFDKKEAKKFLASKDMAMKEIKLDDEIIDIKISNNKSDDIKDESGKNKRNVKRNKFNSKKAFSNEKLIRIKKDKIKPNKTQKYLKNLSTNIKRIDDENTNIKKINGFIFSKNTKKLMVDDNDIEVSSIINESRNEIYYTKKHEDRNNKNKKIDFNSGNESFVNILASLM
jgi:hypothetical protein